MQFSRLVPTWVSTGSCSQVVPGADVKSANSHVLDTHDDSLTHTSGASAGIAVQASPCICAASPVANLGFRTIRCSGVVPTWWLAFPVCLFREVKKADTEFLMIQAYKSHSATSASFTVGGDYTREYYTIFIIHEYWEVSNVPLKVHLCRLVIKYRLRCIIKTPIAIKPPFK